MESNGGAAQNFPHKPMINGCKRTDNSLTIEKSSDGDVFCLYAITYWQYLSVVREAGLPFGCLGRVSSKETKG